MSKGESLVLNDGDEVRVDAQDPARVGVCVRVSVRVSVMVRVRVLTLTLALALALALTLTRWTRSSRASKPARQRLRVARLRAR